jgi:hypothetical protein
MSAPTGNIRGQRTQSSTSGYKTIGSSIASGNTSGALKRIFINALGTSNGDFNLALTKTLKIPKHYYNNTSNSVYYQQPTFSGKRVPIYTSPSAITLTQVFQSAYPTFSPYPSNTVATFAINNGSNTIDGYIYLTNGQYYANFNAPIYNYIPVNINGNPINYDLGVNSALNSVQVGNYQGYANPYGSNGIYAAMNLTLANSYVAPYNFVNFTGTIST